jgi:predicted NBD/HSP70 family sugar kinase
MRIGIDLGGTKIEAIALDDNGSTLLRRRVPTPNGDYVGTLDAIADLVLSFVCQKGSLGVASPGAISTRTGLLKNSNSIVLNGRPLDSDLSQRVGRPMCPQSSRIAAAADRILRSKIRLVDPAAPCKNIRRASCSRQFASAH